MESKNGTSTVHETSLDTSTVQMVCRRIPVLTSIALKKTFKVEFDIYLLPTLLPVESNCMIKSVKCSIQHLVFFMILT